MVNLTCGRNPWKRASADDSTFRAFTRDRSFLQSILPISDDLNCILQRVFELDPERRISLDELRDRILLCPRLGHDDSAATSLPPTPPYSPVEKPLEPSMAAFDPCLEHVPHLDPLPAQQYPLFPSAHPSMNSQPSFPPINTLTPPGSNHGSPQQRPYTYQARPTVPASRSPFAAQTAFIPSIQSWTRCSQFVPTFGHHAWRHAPVF